jgi:hypothetical protein
MQKKHILNQINPHSFETEHTLIAYEGPFFIDLLTIFGNYLKILTEKDPVIQKKLFKIFVELSQNVAYYAEEYFIIKHEAKKIGIGELRIKEDADQYCLTTKNMVQHKDANILSQRCDIINSSPIDQLKNLKRELRKTSESNKLGARIGLVQAKLISNNNLDYEIIKKNRNYSYFKLSINFDKNEQYEP